MAIKGNCMLLGPAYASTQCFGSKTSATGEMVVHVENRFGFVIVILASCSEVAYSYFFLKHGEVTRVGHEMRGHVGSGVPRKRRPRLSLKARRPWKHEGISRSTWFSRRRKFERYWGEIVRGARRGAARLQFALRRRASCDCPSGSARRRPARVEFALRRRASWGCWSRSRSRAPA